MDGNMPKVSIIILNWNGKEDTIRCLESLKNIVYSNYEIILVDNGSVDGSVELINKTYSDIEIIENRTNLGFAEGNNVGIRKAIKNKANYVLLLNNDTVVDLNFLNELIAIAETTDEIGIVGPTVINYDCRNKIQSAGVKLDWYTGKAKILKMNEIIIEDSDDVVDVDYVSGCAILVKCDLILDIGFLCKEYFAYREEVEWCIRAKKASYRVLCVSKAKIWHKGNATSSKISGFKEYHMTRNNFWFMKKHATTPQYIYFIIYFFTYQLWLKCGIALFNGKPKIIYDIFRGVKDGLFKKCMGTIS